MPLPSASLKCASKLNVNAVSLNVGQVFITAQFMLIVVWLVFSVAKNAGNMLRLFLAPLASNKYAATLWNDG